jgi:hypothetical protein
VTAPANSQNNNREDNVDAVILYLFGAVGAAFYALPMYLAARKGGDGDALPILIMAVIVGGLIADPITRVLGARFVWMVHPDARPLAFGVGLLVNPVAQPLVRTISPLVVEYVANLFRAAIGGGK